MPKMHTMSLPVQIVYCVSPLSPILLHMFSEILVLLANLGLAGWILRQENIKGSTRIATNSFMFL